MCPIATCSCPLTSKRHKEMILATVRQRVPSILSACTVAWDDIGGLDDVKRRLKHAVEWPLRHKAAFERLNLSPPRGVLLHGPPGALCRCLRPP